MHSITIGRVEPVTTTAMKLCVRQYLVPASLALALSSGCRDDDFGVPVDFEAEQAVFDLRLDSGDVEIGPGASTRIETQAVAGYRISASGRTRNGSFEPILGSGAMELFATFTLDLTATLDLPQGSFSGPLESVDVEFDVDIGNFDPFLVGQPVTLLAGLPAERVIRVPVIGLPGVEYVVDLAGGGLLPTFEGVCMRREGDAVQYTGLVKLEPDIRYLTSVEITIPFGGTTVIGPVGIDADLPAAFMHPLDLGTFSVDSGLPIADVFPCGEVEAEPAAVTGTPVTAGSDDGSTDAAETGDSDSTGG